MAAELSLFVDCSVFFNQRSQIFHCYGCYEFFRLNPQTSPVEHVTKTELQTSSLLPPNVASKVFNFPPDLTKVVRNELKEGNEIDGTCTLDDGTNVALFRYKFMEHTITSSWTELKLRPLPGWAAWYRCDTSNCAVACLDIKKQGSGSE